MRIHSGGAPARAPDAARDEKLDGFETVRHCVPSVVHRMTPPCPSTQTAWSEVATPANKSASTPLAWICQCAPRSAEYAIRPAGPIRQSALASGEAKTTGSAEPSGDASAREAGRDGARDAAREKDEFAVLADWFAGRPRAARAKVLGGTVSQSNNFSVCVNAFMSSRDAICTKRFFCQLLSRSLLLAVAEPSASEPVPVSYVLVAGPGDPNGPDKVPADCESSCAA